MDEKQKVLEILEDTLNVPLFFERVLKEVGEPALDKLVADSSNPYDDMVKAALWPSLEPLLIDQVKKLFDKVDGQVG